ncbi:MAG: hypothetical protein A2086_14575 [Spirochaetes bacterium GWD1_27_9]|nr:MAG: hypothetical protein A2Z98_02720 [Spirochaetes bacterium GWB1_27_13]OHD23204.1 MAG: hypothetical protein A2Y34_09440 [Spirochaetes bacterium GWC1_27_15]OHD34090.1 MAG: hypothetical protein A2086_14575 [Spirochaetes bacterium GWD1_27_9]
MDLTNLYDILTQSKVDENVGIKVEKLTGDNYFSFYVAEIAPQKYVRPHYHSKGNEIYQILEGNGLMKIGTVSLNKICWENEFNVKKGDCFTIVENKVHQLFNVDSQKLIAIFGCPASHLGNDRFFVE